MSNINILAEVILILLWTRLMFWTAMGVWFYRTPVPPALPDVPKISVVIPAWNEEHNIAATLQSLARQTLKPADVIVVDDGSVDATSRIATHNLGCLQAGQVVRLDHNGGKAAALNAGVSKANGAFVATIDADTQLAPTALAKAFAALRQTQNDACALTVVVGDTSNMLRRIQSHEYAAALNFERAGQAKLAAISIMPGAATLFTHKTLQDRSFSNRTLTEDADKTLAMLTCGARMTLATDALAYTSAPDTVIGMLHQRARWIAGHMQCAKIHSWPRHKMHASAGLGLANFVLTTLAPVLALVAFLLLFFVGSTPFLHIDWVDAWLLTSALIYGQRTVALYTDPRQWQGISTFVLEPPCTGMLHLASFVMGILRLARRTRTWRR